MLMALDQNSEVLLDLLSRLPSPQLAIAVTQNSALAEHVTTALRRLAARSISEPAQRQDGETQRQGELIANLVRRLVGRGDPSLVACLLPSQSSLVDLALCTNANDLLARLIDESTALSCIQASSLAFERAAKAARGGEEEGMVRVRKAARILASVVSAMPIRKVADDKATKGHRERRNEEANLICQTVEAVRLAYEHLTGSEAKNGNGNSLPLLQTKVSLLDAAWFLSERLLLFGVKSTKQKDEEDLLRVLCGSEPLHGGSLPLVDLPLVVDLALVRPLRRSISAEAGASNRLAALNDRVREQGGPASNDVLDVGVLGSAWAQVASSSRPSPNSVEEAPSNLLSSIFAVLPHLEHNRSGLEARLRTPTYAGKDAASVIQTLLEEEEDADGEVSDMDPDTRNDVEALRLLQERANVFDESQLEGAKMTRGKGTGRGGERLELSSGLSDDVRAAILARAEAPDSDEGEEWNPFSDAAFEVGFEEEIEEQGEREGMPARGAAAGQEDESEDEGGEGAHRGAPLADRAPSSTSNVASERAAERILIGAWSERGESFFAKENRKSSGRMDVKNRLNELPGRQWDDGLIESWATMFARNPRKDKLLASVEDIMLVGNTNIAGQDGQGQPGGFGPDRGRGGRVLTGQRGRGSGGRGAKRGARGGGRGRGRGRGS